MLNYISSYSVNQDHLSYQECLTIFPEARSAFILPKLRELESGIAKLKSDASTKLRRSKHLQDGWFVREMVKACEINDLINLKRKLDRLKRYFPQQLSRSRVDQLRIDRAKEYPIIQVAEAYLPQIQKCGGTYRSLCPYHEERTPSFFLYQRTNTFHCFGCQEHGDVIALTQKLQGIGFIEAVKYLAPVYES